MRQQRSAGVGLGLALLSAVTFSTSGTFARSLIDAGWSAEAAVAARVGVAALLLAVPAALSLRGNWHVLRRNLGMIGVFGLLAVAGAQACFFNAVQYLPIGIALLLEYLGIILVVGWMWVVHGHRPRRLTVAGSAAAVLGLVLVLDLAGGRLDPVGVLWGMGAGIGLAAYFVLWARGDGDLPSTAMASGGMAVGAGALLALGAAGALPLHATFGEVQLAGHRTSWLVPVVGLSLLTEVIFGFLVAWLVLGELPTAVQLLGGAFIVAGVALVRAAELRPPATKRVPNAGRLEPALVRQDG